MATNKTPTASKHTVTQSNRLIEAAHTLTLNEKRLVLLAASKLDPRKPLPKDGFITVRADEFADTFDLAIRSVYQVLDEIATRLFNRDIKRYKGQKLVEQMRWVYHVKYLDGRGAIELGFSPTVVPHLTLLNKEFTSYQLKQVGSLSSFYALRLYELMAQFIKLKERYCPLEDLRCMLDLGAKYAEFRDLRKTVLDPGVKEINDCTDLEVAYELRRKGRKVVGLEFAIRRKAGGEHQLEMPLPPG